MTPTLVFHGGRIHSCDSHATRFDAISIAGKSILACGSDADILASAGPETRVVDLAGKAMIPGMTDGHAHMDREGLRDRLPKLSDARSIADVLDIVSEAARSRPAGSWIITQPLGSPPEYDQAFGGLKDGRYPDRHDLDKVSPNHPVYIRPIWGYWRNSAPLASIANSAALRIAGIDSKTQPPSEDVIIERDASGEPTGVFFENTMIPLVEHTLMRCAPGFSLDDRSQGLMAAMKTYNQFGVTAVFEGHGVASEVLRAYSKVRESGNATIKASLAFSPNWQISGQGEAGELLAEWGAWLRGKGMGDQWMRVQGIYAEIDSEPENNALRAANHPCTGWAGFQSGASLPQEALQALLIEAARNGIRASGIWPNLLPLFARAHRAHDITSLRWVLGHQAFLSREQIDLVKDLGLVITTHTNRHIYKDGDKLMQRRPEAIDDLVPLRRLIDEKVPVAFGSDNLPVSLFGPVWHAVARRSRAGVEVAPRHAITREESMRIATAGGAYLTFDENTRGVVAPGMAADLCVLNADPMSCDIDSLAGIRATQVYLDGEDVQLR